IQSGSPTNLSTYSQKRLEGTLDLGADAVVWTSNHVGVVGSIGYAPSQVAVTDSTGTRDEIGSLLLASARVLFCFTPMKIVRHVPGGRAAPWSFYFGAGGGFATRSGAVWSYYSGLTSPAAVASFGVRRQLRVRSGLRGE